MSRPDSSAQRSARQSAWNGVMHVRGGLLGCAGRCPASGAHAAAAALSSFGRIPVDLPGVNGVAEDRDQQRPGSGGDRAGVRASPRADPGRDGFVPGLDLLEGQRAELASLERRQDVELDQVLVLGDGGRLDIVEQPGPDVDPLFQRHPAARTASRQVPCICSVICAVASARASSGSS